MSRLEAPTIAATFAASALGSRTPSSIFPHTPGSLDGFGTNYFNPKSSSVDSPVLRFNPSEFRIIAKASVSKVEAPKALPKRGDLLSQFGIPYRLNPEHYAKSLRGNSADLGLRFKPIKSRPAMERESFKLEQVRVKGKVGRERFKMPLLRVQEVRDTAVNIARPIPENNPVVRAKIVEIVENLPKPAILKTVDIQRTLPKIEQKTTPNFEVAKSPVLSPKVETHSQTKSKPSLQAEVQKILELRRGTKTSEKGDLLTIIKEHQRKRLVLEAIAKAQITARRKKWVFQEDQKAMAARERKIKSAINQSLEDSVEVSGAKIVALIGDQTDDEISDFIKKSRIKMRDGSGDQFRKQLATRGVYRDRSQAESDVLSIHNLHPTVEVSDILTTSSVTKENVEEVVYGQLGSLDQIRLALTS